MTTEYELCGNAIGTLPVVNLHSSLNDHSLNEDFKDNQNISVLQIHNLSASEDIALDKRLSGEYITLPIESNIKYSVSYICRICASTIDFDSAVNIFPNDEFQENLAFKINKYLPIIVYESDPFPKTICRSCVSKLNQFHELVEKCVLVEEQFRHTYVFDGRYLEELSRKVNTKPELELLKNETENLYSISDFNYIENLNNTATENKKESPKTVDCISCKFCAEELKTPQECINHSTTHIDNELMCCCCDVAIKSKPEWELHIKTHFDSKNIKKLKPQQPKLKHKLKIYSKVLCCKKCKETLENVDVAIEHCLKHKPANIKSFPCVVCVKRIGKSKLREHVSVHYPSTTKPLFSCDNCNNLYPDEKTLKYHRCTKLRKFKCTQCKQGFKSEDRLKFHEDFHKNKSTFCEICKKDFKFESRIYLHFAGVHNGIREKPYCCDVCGKTFTWLTVLNSHKRTHTNERPFKCSKCDARFCNKYSLRGHMPSHDDHPQFYCDKCDYHTGRKQNLQKHIGRFHREINSSQICVCCKICDEIFPNKQHFDVEEHQSKHPPEEVMTENAITEELELTKLYQCERCERCYASSEHLTKHRMRHVTDDPSSLYQCRLCDNGFPKHDLLVKHQKVHVNVSSQYNSKLSILTVISCDICGIECVDYRQLLNHKDRGNCMMKKISGTIRPKKVLIKKHLKPLKTHQLFINSNGLFECPTCQRTYKNRRRYRLHLATHSNVSL